MQEKVWRQIRTVKKYAKAIHCSLDVALQRWVDTGCAQRWAERYDENYD